MHRYTPIITHSEGGGGEDEKPPIAVPPTSIRSLATTALLMLVSGITGALILSLIQRHASTVSMAASTPQLERLQNLLSVPLETVKFMPDDVFAAPASPQTDEAWMEMLGPSKGFIALENPEDYGLAPGRSLQNSTHQVYGVTMFHELHCLMMLRDIHYGLLQGKYNASDYDSTGGSPNQPYIFEHTEHCFDFLQQSIRCAGLLQIEYPRGGRKNIFDGYGSEHTCKSWESIVGFMNEFQVPSRRPGGEHVMSEGS